MTGGYAIAEVLEALTGVRHAHADAVRLVPSEPGIYVFCGGDRAWADLGLTPAFDDQPLYVGKAERSLRGRDVGTHFAAGKTGSSTVRRSRAALLADGLVLVAVPRNGVKPDGSANFGLDDASEDRLSSWMEQRLSLATWSTADSDNLDEIETEVLRRLHPPLNLAKAQEQGERLRLVRQRMATAARAWQPAEGHQDGGDPGPEATLLESRC